MQVKRSYLGRAARSRRLHGCRPRASADVATPAARGKLGRPLAAYERLRRRLPSARAWPLGARHYYLGRALAFGHI